MPAVTQPDFLDLFRERHNCFAQLLAMSTDQLTLIDSGEYSQLMTILGRKQRVINQLEEIQQQHPDLAADWKAKKAKLPASIRSACDQLLNDTERLLSQLMELEKAGTDQIAQTKDETRTELLSLNRSAQANSTYGTNLTPATGRRLSSDG